MNVVVTGASRGIGYHTVLSMAQQNVDKIIGIARSEKELLDLKDIIGERFVPIVYDMETICDNNDHFIHHIQSHVQSVDILINNAGTIIAKPFKDISKVEMEHIFSVNYFAPALIVKALLPFFTKKAHVVSISSIGGFQGSTKFTGLAHYSASKAALACLTECLAEEFQKEEISFNALAIGAVQTDMLTKAFPGYKAPIKPEQMGKFISDFALNGNKYMNGKVLPISLSTP